MEYQTEKIESNEYVYTVWLFLVGSSINKQNISHCQKNESSERVIETDKV